MTRREEIEKLLEKQPWSAQKLANYFRVEMKEILEDLEHVRKSVKPRKLVIEPAYCPECGFVFKERTKIKKPSKCPKCRNENIEEPLFKIV